MYESLIFNSTKIGYIYVCVQKSLRKDFFFLKTKERNGGGPLVLSHETGLQCRKHAAREKQEQTNTKKATNEQGQRRALLLLLSFARINSFFLFIYTYIQ